MRQGDRGFERVANRVRQQAIAVQPAARFQFAGAERVHEHKDVQGFALGPEGVEFGVGEILARHAAAHAHAAETEGLDGVLDLFGGEVGILQGGGGKGDEPIGLRGAELDQCLVLHPDQFGCCIALGSVPEGIDAERLDIDASLVHLRQAVAEIGPQQTRRFQWVIDQVGRLRDNAVRVYVNGLNAPATDGDLAASLCRRLPRSAACPEAVASADFAVDKGQGRVGRRGVVDLHFRSSRSLEGFLSCGYRTFH